VAGIASTMKSILIPSIPQSAQTGTLNFPRVKVGNVSTLTNGSIVTFNYPLDDEPNIMAKLGAPASGGVGPDKDIVAFSQICQHAGCPSVAYVPKGSSPQCRKTYVAEMPVGYCCCHGSVYDFTDGAKVIGGPSPRPQPQVILDVDASGDIYAVGMEPPTIFGHNTGSSDVSADLQGGNLVK
jgi:arsenite oxidase small subunit